MEEIKRFEPEHLELSEEAILSGMFVQYCKGKGLSKHDIGLLNVVTTAVDKKVDDEEGPWFDEYVCADILESLYLMGENVPPVFNAIAEWMEEFKSINNVHNEAFDEAIEQECELRDFINTWWAIIEEEYAKEEA